MGIDRWDVGDVVVRREVLHGHAWVGFATYVVADEPDLLALYIAPGSELAFATWPFDRWEHPWRTAGHRRWHGHGKLMLHRPGDPYSVDVFWAGEDRDFAGWYLNLQDPFRRLAAGIDTLDHELDFWVPAQGAWEVKDAELFEQRVAEERYTAAQAADIRAVGDHLRGMLGAGEHWWDASWATWSPPVSWGPREVPGDWATRPAPTTHQHAPSRASRSDRSCIKE